MDKKLAKRQKLRIEELVARHPQSACEWGRNHATVLVFNDGPRIPGRPCPECGDQHYMVVQEIIVENHEQLRRSKELRKAGKLPVGVPKYSLSSIPG